MIKKLLGFIFLGLLPLSVYAVRLTNLYQAEIPVTSQSTDDREQAVTDGFRQVLIKLSSDPDIGKNPIVKPNLRKANYYVQDYSYSAPTTDSSQYLIRIRYSVDDVNRLLNKANVPYWGEQRPLVIVWLTYAPLHQSATIVDDDAPGDMLTTMKAQGKKYGLPLIFPVMDVTDMDQVDTDEVSNMNLPALKAASKRYAPTAYLIGRIQEGANDYQSQWKLVLNNNQWTWTVADKTTTGIVTTLLNAVSQTLAKNYLAPTSEAQDLWLKLEIVNVTERNDLTALTQLLEQLAPVQQVELSQIDGAMVKLAVKVHGSLATFQKSATGRHLILKAQDVATNKLIYEWVK